MESSLQYKVFNFFMNQGLCPERLDNQIRIKINEELLAWIQISRKLKIVVECLNMPIVIPSKLRENFLFAEPNLFTWNISEYVENVGDVLIKLSECANKFQDFSKAEESFWGLKENCAFFEINKDEYFRITGLKPGNYFKEFFVLVSEENVAKKFFGEKFYKIKCFVEIKKKGYKLVKELSFDFYSKPFGERIKDLSDDIQTLITTSFSNPELQSFDIDLSSSMSN